MKNLLIAIIIVSGFSYSSIAQNNDMDSLSYYLGMMIGHDLNQQGFDQLDLSSFVTGMQKSQVASSEKEMQNAQMYLQKHQEKQHADAMEENMMNEREFLTQNKQKEGIQETASGLQYLVITEGEGPTPEATDQVKVHYTGTLIDGTVFDSSVQRGEPATFGVNQVIQGWQEALQMMPEGAKWKLFIPADLAYGERGAGGVIGPNETLIFEVELLEILE